MTRGDILDTVVVGHGAFAPRRRPPTAGAAADRVAPAVRACTPRASRSRPARAGRARRARAQSGRATLDPRSVTAILLAAGVGRRLFGSSPAATPKCLLRFGGRTLLERHLAILESLEVPRLSLVVGYRQEAVLAELHRHAAGLEVNIVENPRYREGSGVSLWHARDALLAGTTVLFMDADVLYHPHLLERVLHAPGPSSVPLDPDFEDGEEPVKVCVDGRRIVAFGKSIDPTIACDTVGEWPGFVKLSPALARAVAGRLDAQVSRGEVERPYEDAMGAALLAAAAAEICIENVAGVPWIEIDFPADRDRAETRVLPAIRRYAPGD